MATKVAFSTWFLGVSLAAPMHPSSRTCAKETSLIQTVSGMKTQFEQKSRDGFGNDAARTTEQQGGGQFPCPQGCAWCIPSGQSNDVVVESDVQYGEAVNLETGQVDALLMDTYKLRHRRNTAKMPVVLVIHGGAFMKTSTKVSGLATRAARIFAQHGYWVASIEYRRYFEYCSINQRECWWGIQDKPPLYAHPVHDTLAAVRYLNKHAAQLGIDSQKIALFGCSAGGIIIADTLMRDYGEGNSGNAGYPSVVSAGISLSGAMSGGSIKSQKSAGEIIPPYLAFHNDPDPTVPYSHAVRTKAFLDGRGSANSLITIPSSGHCPEVLSGDYLQDILGFLQKSLQLPGSACSVGAPVSNTLPVGGEPSLAPTTAQPPQKPLDRASSKFMPVDGGVNRACRGADVNDNTEDNHELHSEVDSLQDCQAKCAATWTCTGVEFFSWGNHRRCEVWTTAISTSSTYWGAHCFRYSR